MRRISLLLLALLASSAFSASRTDKDSLVNTRYQETAAEKAAREFKEIDAQLPALPDPKSGDWFDLYISEDYPQKPKILLSSLQIMPAPDTSIRYILNTQSSKGHDNLTFEGLFCARSTFTYAKDKRSSYKVFGYGDLVNNRWIQARHAEWKLIGDAMNRKNDVRTVLYEAFCVDGMPHTVEGLVERLQQRTGHRQPTMMNQSK